MSAPCNYFITRHFNISTRIIFNRQSSYIRNFYITHPSAISPSRYRNMSNQAAILETAKAPLTIVDKDIPQPGQDEVVVRNEALGLNPIDAKLQKLAMFPLKYPHTLGSLAAGTIHSSNSSKFSPGDRVVSFTSGAFQKYVLSSASTTVKLPDNYKLEDAAGLIGGMATSFSALDLYGKLSRKDGKGKVLIYGGSSHVGGYAVQYAAQAGYDVVTTTSPGNRSVVDTLGAKKVVDHTQPAATVSEELKSVGPYDVIFDAIGVPDASRILAEVVQPGQTIYATLPLMDPSIKLPEGVEIKFYSYSVDLAKNADSKRYYYEEYLPEVFNGKRDVKPTNMEKVDGGLGSLQKALDRLFGGVSGIKLWVNPQE